ncbi:MAG: hypothetical protein K0M55_06955 [Rhizobium sp.]|nr:hypothetical protein [Rhizobium sp.]
MLSVIVDRLEANPGTLTEIQVAEDLDAVVDGTAPDSGTAFVVPFREIAKPNTRMTGAHLQRVDVQFLVAFVVRYHDDAAGAERAAMFDGLKTSAEAALAGWQPSPEGDPCSLVGSETNPLGNGVTLYVQTWQTSRYITGA